MKSKYLTVPVVLVWVAAAAWVVFRAIPSWNAKEACLKGQGVWDSAAQSCKYPAAPTTAAPTPLAAPVAPAVPTDDGKPIPQPPH